jgi:4-hydroxy-4-methyl-2-oxoglutarate aldolase
MSEAGAVLTVRREFKRPDAALLRAFAGAQTGHVVDAQGRRGALAHAIRPVSQAAAFAGPALTVATRSRDNLACWAALKEARPGDVLIIATGTTEEAAIVGDTMMGMARNCGIVACVTDGLARDVAGIDAVGLPVWAAGVTPNSPWKDGPGMIGGTVTLGGVVIAAGDLVIGDPDGVVIVPQATIPAVLAELAIVRQREAAMEAAIAAGARLPAWLEGLLAEKGVRVVD